MFIKRLGQGGLGMLSTEEIAMLFPGWSKNLCGTTNITELTHSAFPHVLNDNL